MNTKFSDLSYDDKFNFLGFQIGHGSTDLPDSKNFDDFVSGFIPINKAKSFLAFVKKGRRSIAIDVMDGFLRAKVGGKEKINQAYHGGTLPNNRPHYRGT